MSSTVYSPRLRLLSCDMAILHAISAGDEQLAAHLEIEVPKNWTEFGPPMFQFVADRLKIAPEEARWWAYLPVYQTENLLLGSCGFKGPPGPEGTVEIGYEVVASHRLRGFATEIAQTLISHAFMEKEVRSVCAHTLPEENASVKVLRKCGMTWQGTAEDPEEGEVWKWEIDRAAWESS